MNYILSVRTGTYEQPHERYKKYTKNFMYFIALYEEEASSVEYFSDYVLVFPPHDGRIKRPKKAEKLTNVLTAFKGCVCPDNKSLLTVC
jgi:hypothetical protein